MEYPEFDDNFTVNLFILNYVYEENRFDKDESDIKKGKRRYRAMIAKELETDKIARRFSLARRITEKQQDGKVALVVDSMDCDCVRVIDSYIVNAAPFLIEQEIERIYEGAEGPTSIWIESPDDMPEPSSRDLALEAFEDGHQHVVYR